MRFRLFSISFVAVVAMAVFNGFAHSQDGSITIPRPNDKPADQTKKVQVFILLGQSNMLGFGRVGPKETKGTLEYMIQEKGKYDF